MLHRIFGWHVIPWTDAFCEAVRRLERPPRTVLEIGASRLSAPSLFFLRKGASVDVSCYADTELPALTALCEDICHEYGLPMPAIRTHDVFSATKQAYDVIIMKGVLGGLNRHHDVKVFARAIESCLGNLSENGSLIVLDKGWCSPVHNLLLRRFGDAGGNSWHYFTQRDLDSLSAHGGRPQVIWKGYASPGTMPSRRLQRFADFLDTRFFNRFLAHRGVVFAALYSNNGTKTMGREYVNSPVGQLLDLDGQPPQ